MPVYTFKIDADGACLHDETGVSLRDRPLARQYAEQVAREMMARREKSTRHWHIDVYENDQLFLELPFSSVDPTMDNLSPELRATVVVALERKRSFKAVLEKSRRLALEASALVARSRGQLYLAAQNGESAILDR